MRIRSPLDADGRDGTTDTSEVSASDTDRMMIELVADGESPSGDTLGM